MNFGLVNVDSTNTPVIHSIEPNQGTCLGGTVLTIEGENLGDHCNDVIKLEIGSSDLLLSMKYVSSNKIMVTTKPHKPGDAPVTIRTYAGKVTSSNVFRFVNDSVKINGCNKVCNRFYFYTS